METKINGNRDKELVISKDKFVIVGFDQAKSEEILRPSLSFWADAWRRLKKNKAAIVSMIILIVVILLVLVGPLISGYEFDALGKVRKSGPTFQHWFGTDSLGRDYFTRVCMGGRISLKIGFVGTAINVVVGCIYGGIAGYYGGIVDDIMMRIIEIVGSIPYLVLVILFSLLLGKSVFSLIVALTVTGWLGIARLLRGQLLQIREQEYVLAATALGGNSQRIITRHLIPNTLGVLIVSITFMIPNMIYNEAFLGYIGLGVQLPDTSWGALTSAARNTMITQPYQMVFPALLISLTMLSFQLLGDGLRDALDPKLRQ